MLRAKVSLSGISAPLEFFCNAPFALSTVAFNPKKLMISAVVPFANKVLAVSVKSVNSTLLLPVKYMSLFAAVVTAAMAVSNGLRGCFCASSSVIVVAKLGSLPNASANSAKVFNVSGEEPTNSAIASRTQDVVEMLVSFESFGGFGDVGLPVKFGECLLAFNCNSSFSCLTVDGVAASVTDSLVRVLLSLTIPLPVVLASIKPCAAIFSARRAADSDRVAAPSELSLSFVTCAAIFSTAPLLASTEAAVFATLVAVC